MFLLNYVFSNYLMAQYYDFCAKKLTWLKKSAYTWIVIIIRFLFFFTECGGKNFHFVHETADIGKTNDFSF